MILVAALATGGRDQLMVARWAATFGQSTQLLALAIASACLTAAAMAYIGAELAAILPRRAAQMLVAFALAIAAAELVLPVRLAPAREPTRSLAALGIVLVARQFGDAARFAVFALAAWAVWPVTAGLGGAVGGAAAVALGWGASETALAKWRLPLLRRVLAAGLAVTALFIGLDARLAAA